MKRRGGGEVGGWGVESRVEEECQPSLPRNYTHILNCSSTRKLHPMPCMGIVGMIKDKIVGTEHSEMFIESNHGFCRVDQNHPSVCRMC